MRSVAEPHGVFACADGLGSSPTYEWESLEVENESTRTVDLQLSQDSARI